MPDNQRIEDLRRRVHKDPASIAFAQLAEELRRAGQLDESVTTCRAGLALHPSYLSARVTLGRALLDLNDLDAAADELTVVLKNAPENLAAMKGLGEVHVRRGHDVEALAQFRAALAIARNDPDLAETVADLARKVEPKDPSASSDGLTQSEFLQHLPAPPLASPPVLASPPAAPSDDAPVAVPNADLTVNEQTLATLEKFLAAVHVARADRSP
jgi:tetratricopeptide (TPR) repeat protein